MTTKIYENQYVSFIEALNKNRAMFDKMLAIVLRSQTNDNDNPSDAKKKNDLDEVVQVLQFHFNGEEAIMLTNADHKRIFLVLVNHKSRALTILERAIEEEFGKGRVEFELSAPMNKGLEKICDLLTECIDEKDLPSLISVKRFARRTNTYAVFSTDPGVQSRLTTILQSSGSVISFKSIDNMLESYNGYAPEVIFIDNEGIKDQESRRKIHHLLRHKDPMAYSVIISSQPDAGMVLECKKIGIKGVLLWPTSYQAMFSRLSKIPGLKLNRSRSA